MRDEKKLETTSGGIERELESVIGRSEQTHANPELDAIMDQAVELSVKGEDTLELEVQIDGKNPSREWILLQGYKGYKALAALYRNNGEYGLEKFKLAEAMVRARAIRGGRDVEATTLPLPSLSVELHDAIQNLAFFRSNMLKKGLESSEPPDLPQ